MLTLYCVTPSLPLALTHTLSLSLYLSLSLSLSVQDPLSNTRSHTHSLSLHLDRTTKAFFSFAICRNEKKMMLVDALKFFDDV